MFAADALFAVTELGCWAHARRKFFDAAQMTKKAGAPHAALAFSASHLPSAMLLLNVTSIGQIPASTLAKEKARAAEDAGFLAGNPWSKMAE